MSKRVTAVDAVPKEDSSEGLSCGPGLTKQEYAERSDINDIIARFERTGMAPDVAGREAFFADVSRVGDFRSHLNMIVQAQEMFDELPALVRRRFDNDPAKLLEFVGDVKNRDEAVKLGLVVAPKVAPVVEPVVPAPVVPAAKPA